MSSFIGALTTGSTSGTVPTHVANDLLIVISWRSTTTAPTLATGFTNFSNGSGNSQAYRIGYKWCTGTSDTSGTWTNATSITCIIIRGASGLGVLADNTAATTTSRTIPALGTFTNTNGKSKVMAWCISKQITSQSTPTGMTSDYSNTGGSAMGTYWELDSVTSFASHTTTLGATAVSSAGAFEILTNDNYSTFADPFTGVSLDATKWGSFTAGSATLAFAGTGASSIMPASTTSTSDADITSLKPYDMTGNGGYLHVLSAYAGTTATDATFSLLNIDGSQSFSFQVESGTLFAENIIGGSQTNLTSATFSTTTHAWWKIRESSGTIFWDTSTDGITWTNFFNKANPLPLGTIWSMYTNIGGSAFQADTSPGTFKWINFNTSPSTTPSYLFFF